jgi:hypothetical protein
VGGVNAIDYSTIATRAISQAARYAADGCNADPRQVVNPAIREPLFQVFNDLPAIDERLKLRGCAEVLEEIAALIRALEADYSVEKRVFGACLLALRFVPIRFH